MATLAIKMACQGIQFTVISTSRPVCKLRLVLDNLRHSIKIETFEFNPPRLPPPPLATEVVAVPSAPSYGYLIYRLGSERIKYVIR